MKHSKLYKLLACTCLLATSGLVTSCGEESSISSSPSASSSSTSTIVPLAYSPLETIYAYTPKTEELTADYYKNVIKSVSANKKWDVDFIAQAQFVDTSDGDTTKLIVNTSKGRETKEIRYYAIDTPELHHPSKGAEAWGLAAKQFVEYRFKEAKENGWPIVVEAGKTSIEYTYEREVGYIWCGPHLINLELVEIGLGKYYADTNNENDRHADWAFEVNKERSGANGYPTTPLGDMMFHVTNYIDPNWDTSKETGKHEYVENNPAVKDLNYKYNFNFDLSGKLEDILLCNENVNLCLS